MMQQAERRVALAEEVLAREKQQLEQRYANDGPSELPPNDAMFIALQATRQELNKVQTTIWSSSPEQLSDGS